MKKIRVAAAIIKKGENILLLGEDTESLKTDGNSREEKSSPERLLAAL